MKRKSGLFFLKIAIGLGAAGICVVSVFCFANRSVAEQEAATQGEEQTKFRIEAFEVAEKTFASASSRISSDGKTLLRYFGNGDTFEVPEGIEEIAYHAFDNCLALSTIKLPASVKKVDSKAFIRCRLSRFEVDEKNPYYASVDGVLFSKDGKTLCQVPPRKNLVKYEVPKGVETIDDIAFFECFSLKSIVLSDGLKTIGQGAFLYCRSLTTISIPKSVETIGGIAFAGCDLLSSITVEEGSSNYVSDDGALLADGGKTLIRYPQAKPTTRYAVPSTVEKIAQESFGSCNMLREVDVPDSVKFIEFDAFWNCRNLETITIPAGVERIDDDAFRTCPLLTIRAPENSAAERCAKTNYIGFEKVALVPETIKSSDGRSETRLRVASLSNFDKDCDCVFDFSRKILLRYEGTDGTFDVPDGVEEIGYEAFARCDALRTVNIPASVKKIDESAFLWNSSITTINVDKGNPSYQVRDGVLYSKDGKTLCLVPPGLNLQTFEIPSDVEHIGKFSFVASRLLAAVVIPESVKTIGENAFAGCPFASIVIPKSVETIERLAFARCDRLALIYVAPENRNYASVDGVLLSKDGKTFVKYPIGKTNVSYDVPEGVEEICERAFERCSSLIEIKLPEGVKSVGRDAFVSCSSLQIAVIPEGVDSVSYDAFLGSARATLYCAENSPAEKIARRALINFLPIEEYKPIKVTRGKPAQNGAVISR